MPFWAPDIGIDLGTENVSLYVRGRGVVISEPALVVLDREDRHTVQAVGDEASFLLGRSPDRLTPVWPIRMSMNPLTVRRKKPFPCSPPERRELSAIYIRADGFSRRIRWSSSEEFPSESLPVRMMRHECCVPFQAGHTRFLPAFPSFLRTGAC